MSIYLKVQLDKQPVLIVGGGKVAYRKAKTYYEQGAQLFILSESLHEDFETIPCTWIKENYHTLDLSVYFFVYAATNQLHINEQICNDANAQHVLCASANKTHANAISMAYQETEQFQVALASSTPCPPLYPHILDEFTKLLQPYDEKMKDLTILRNRLQLVLDDEQQRKAYAYEYASVEATLLHSLANATKKKKVLILLYHGSQNPQAIKEEVLPFQAYIQARVEVHVMSVYIKAEYLSIQAKQAGIISYEQALHLLQPLQQLIWVQPMLLAKGHYYERYVNSVLHMGTPLIDADCSFLNDWMNSITPHACVALYHANRPCLDQHLLTSLTQHHYSIHDQNIETMNIDEVNITLCSMYVLRGYHQHQDMIHCANKLSKAGKQVHIHDESFLQHPMIRCIWLKKIIELLKN